MFLRFTVMNHGSFRDQAELSFIATARRDEPAWKMTSAHVTHGVLPTLGLWGANASGKSQLIDSLLFMRDAVHTSHALWPATARVPWNPWRLDLSGPPTRMELELLIDDVRFAFGFTLSEIGFAEEWLFRWEGSRRQILYHRDATQPEPKRFYFGPSLRGSRQAIAAMTRANSLFLSAAAQQNHDILLPVYRAIVDGMQPGLPIELRGHPLFDADDTIFDDRDRAKLIRLLQAADIGVCDVKVETADDDAMTLMSRLPQDLDQIFKPEFIAQVQQHRSRKRSRLLLVHRSEDGDSWSLPPELESRGTQVLIVRIRDVLRSLARGTLLVVDELDTSLHPDLCAAIVDLFTAEATNPSGAQLLFTTHDRGLLARLRTDEVVMVDKSWSGVSSIRAGSDYKGLRTRDDLREAHEQGRIGGVPVLSEFGAALGDTDGRRPLPRARERSAAMGSSPKRRSCSSSARVRLKRDSSKHSAPAGASRPR
jgi:alpha-D-ribose 1-methylphosphonate 5-triphosphate synthase subunit PhnL